MTITRSSLYCCLGFLLTCALLQGQTQTSGATEDSCRKFVQQFYDWYLPQAKKQHSPSPGDIVVKYKSQSFSRELRMRLKEDSDAQARSRDLVGLDFDPFLNTQDPGFERCTVGKIVRKTASYWAEVTCVFPGANAEKSKIMPELVLNEGRWLFVNFHYREGAKAYDLLTMLKALREDRKPKSK